MSTRWALRETDDKLQAIQKITTPNFCEKFSYVCGPRFQKNQRQTQLRTCNKVESLVIFKMTRHLTNPVNLHGTDCLLSPSEN